MDVVKGHTLASAWNTFGALSATFCDGPFSSEKPARRTSASAASPGNTESATPAARRREDDFGRVLAPLPPPVARRLLFKCSYRSDSVARD